MKKTMYTLKKVVIFLINKELYFLNVIIHKYVRISVYAEYELVNKQNKYNHKTKYKPSVLNMIHDHDDVVARKYVRRFNP